MCSGSCRKPRCRKIFQSNSTPSVVGGRDYRDKTTEMIQMFVQHDHLPNPLVPFVFIDCCGASQPSEARYCQDLARALMAYGISASSIAILIFFKDQQHFLAWFSSSSGIALHTLACIRGCDYGIVILLLICADVTTDTGARLDDPLRLNVA
ncbi:hypothetical protein Q1695_012170 [Nippostrongylus brasiliensis]|nr:hypothetical protein Q1695_012170 [Nippostrongylus brasiliensis]